MAIMYQNSICRMFDQNCIQEQYLQKRHNEQMWKTIECANKLDVFFEVYRWSGTRVSENSIWAVLYGCREPYDEKGIILIKIVVKEIQVVNKLTTKWQYNPLQIHTKLRAFYHQNQPYKPEDNFVASSLSNRDDSEPSTKCLRK